MLNHLKSFAFVAAVLVGVLGGAWLGREAVRVYQKTQAVYMSGAAQATAHWFAPLVVGYDAQGQPKYLTDKDGNLVNRAMILEPALVQAVRGESK